MSHPHSPTHSPNGADLRGLSLLNRKVHSAPAYALQKIRSKPQLLDRLQHAPKPIQRLLARLELRPALVPIERLASTYARVLEILDSPPDVLDGPPDVLDSPPDEAGTQPDIRETGARQPDNGHDTPGHELVYLEFGVSQGSSMLCMHRALSGSAQWKEKSARLIGFDSFEGLPPETVTVKDQGGDAWRPGQFASRQSYTESYLRAHGVPRGRVELVKGWFSETLNEWTVARLGLKRADIIMIDCDIYTAAAEALAFCADLITSTTIIVFDDWGDENTPPNVGEEKAFSEFLAANPHISARELPDLSYHACSRVFEVSAAPKSASQAQPYAAACNA